MRQSGPQDSLWRHIITFFQGGGETCNYFDRTNTDSISKMLANI